MPLNKFFNLIKRTLMKSLLDINKEFDVNLFEEVVIAAFSPNNDRKNDAEEILIKFKEQAGSWKRVDAVMKGGKGDQCKFIALQILEDSVKQRWSLFTEEEKVSVRVYVIELIVSLTSGCGGEMLLGKVDDVLVEIAKRDWPKKWPDFINGLIQKSLDLLSVSMRFAQNTLDILRMLNEQVFMYQEEMSTAKRTILQNTLKQEYGLIFEFISFIFECSGKWEVSDALVVSCLKTFQSFCTSMPLEFVLSKTIIDSILSHLNSPQTLATLDCLLEIISKGDDCVSVDRNFNEFSNLLNNKNQNNDINPNNSNNITNRDINSNSDNNINTVSNLKNIDNNMRSEMRNAVIRIHEELVGFFGMYMEKLGTESLRKAYNAMEADEKVFVGKMGVVFAQMYAGWFDELSTSNSEIRRGLRFLIDISKIDDGGLWRNVFPAWSSLVGQFYGEYTLHVPTTRQLRRNEYTEIMQALLEVCVERMPKPTEVFIFVNELGEIVREKRVETIEIEFYQSMQTTMFRLGFCLGRYALNYFIRRLNKFSVPEIVESLNTAYEGFNKLCWSIGALAGVFEETEEREFFVSAINKLLVLCETRYRREERAIIASNVMFIIGQYKRFLKYNTEFMFVVVCKLFEFMREEYEGVREMACDNFLKICERCPNQFLIRRKGRVAIDVFIEELVTAAPSLDFYLQRIVIEGFLFVLSSVYAGNNTKKASINNNSFNSSGSTVVSSINNSSSKSFSSYSSNDKVKIYVESIYTTITNQNILDQTYFAGVLQLIRERNNHHLKMVCHLLESYALGFKILPSVFSEITNLDAFIQLFRKIMELDGKEAPFKNTYVLNTLILSSCKFFEESIKSGLFDSSYYNKICAGVICDFNTTLNHNIFAVASAIVKNDSNTSEEDQMRRMQFYITNLISTAIPSVMKVDDVPDLVISFLKFILIILETRFDMFWPFIASSNLFDSFINAILAVLTGLHDSAALGLACLSTLCRTCFSQRKYEFFGHYYISILENLFGVVFDKDLKSNFNTQVNLLHYVITISAQIPPLDQTLSNTLFIKRFITDLFTNNFKNITQNAIRVFVEGIFEIKDLALFRDHIRDFNIKIYEYGSDEDIEYDLMLLNERIAKSTSLNI